MERIYYIQLANGKTVNVNKDIYYAYYRPQWRELKYIRACAKRGDCSYDYLSEKNVGDTNLIAEQSFEDSIIDKLLYESLMNIVNNLAFDERRLILALYFDYKTEREFAKELGISQAAVHKRKHRILNKLKKMIKT